MAFIFSLKMTVFLLSLQISWCSGKGDRSEESDTLEKYSTVIELKGGTYEMGTGVDSKDSPNSKGYARTVTVKPFILDAYPVTNEHFRKFVRAKKFKSEAEKFGWSFVFYEFVPEKIRKTIKQSVQGAPWWLPVKRAYWRQPGGPGSSVKGKLNYPAVHISYNDAKQYCAWLGKRLPTEAEWEVAVRGGLKAKMYPWGEKYAKKRINIWQGEFPKENLVEDGYTGVAPVDAFPPQNKYGFYDMVGNAWEWVSDEFSKDQRGEIKYVLRGGSYLDSMDGKFNHKASTTTRMGNTADAGSDNITFRCAKSVKRDEL